MNASLPRRLSLVVISALVCASAFAEPEKLKIPEPSPAAAIKQRVGFTDIEIAYSRPGAKGRQVFGGLEQYGVVWRTGANAATRITFSTSVKFGGVDVPQGTYGLFSIPDPNEWTVILNSVPKQWGAYSYDAKNDVVRVKVKPVKLTEPVETFTIDVNDIRDESATLNLIWQNTCVPVPLQFEVVPTVVKQIDAIMSAPEKPSPATYDQAALFYLEHNLDLNKAGEWIGAAIASDPNKFWLYYHQARILAKKGDKPGAIAAAKHSIELAEGSAKAEYTRLNEKLISSLGQ